MLWSAFTLAFFAFLRSSKFTSPSSVRFNPLVHLSHSDISFTSAGSLSLQLKSSKTDPFLTGCSIMLAPSGRSVCAVRAMHRYEAHQLSGNSTHPFFLNRAISHQGQSNLSSVPPASKLGFCHRVLCIPQFPHWGCNYCCRGRLAPLAYPNPWPLVQQLLHPIHQDTCFNTPSSPCPASRH